MQRTRLRFSTAMSYVLFGAALACASCADKIGDRFAISPRTVTVPVGGTATVAFETNDEKPPMAYAACEGIATVSLASTFHRGLSVGISGTVDGTITVLGLAPGHCTKRYATENADEDLDITVVPPDGADLGVPDLGMPSDLAGLTPICSATVAFMGVENGRDLYMAYTNVDSVPGQACPVHTSTDYSGDIVFSFYSNSPGYTIDGRGNYEILTASPATVTTTAGASSATALEDQIITMTFRRRVYPDQDASVPPPTWTMAFRMKSDPDPAKWKVELFSFSSQ